MNEYTDAFGCIRRNSRSWTWLQRNRKTPRAQIFLLSSIRRRKKRGGPCSDSTATSFYPFLAPSCDPKIPVVQYFNKMHVKCVAHGRYNRCIGAGHGVTKPLGRSDQSLIPDDVKALLHRYGVEVRRRSQQSVADLVKTKIPFCLLLPPPHSLRHKTNPLAILTCITDDHRSSPPALCDFKAID